MLASSSTLGAPERADQAQRIAEDPGRQGRATTHASYAHDNIRDSELHWIPDGSHVGFWVDDDAETHQGYVRDWLRALQPGAEAATQQHDQTGNATQLDYNMPDAQLRGSKPTTSGRPATAADSPESPSPSSLRDHATRTRSARTHQQRTRRGPRPVTSATRGWAADTWTSRTCRGGPSAFLD